MTIRPAPASLRLLRILTAGTLMLCGFLLLVAGATTIPDTTLRPPPGDPSGRYSISYQRHRFITEPVQRALRPLAAREEWARGAHLLESAVARHPDCAILRVWQADLARRQQDWATVDAIADGLLCDFPDVPDASWLKGESALARGDAQSAVRYLGTFLSRLPEKDSRRVPTLASLSRACLEAHHWEEAARHAGEWIAREDSLAGREVLLTSAVRREDWKEAREQADAALALVGEGSLRGALHLQKGYILSALKKFPEAEREFAAAAEYLAGPAYQQEIRRRRGELAYRRGDFVQAARCFKGCLLEGFDESTAESYLAALEQSRQWPVGVLEIHDLLHRPDLTPAFRESLRRRLLACYKAMEDYASCYAMARQFYLETGEAAYLLELAELAEQTGRADDALKLFEAHTGREAEHGEPRAANTPPKLKPSAPGT